ncbi:hypothetical protein LTR70_002209 [Exophiala xenobiotica]|uniref:Uncharacterized protein n=1 Tax=Lithohypha guttulata TaxID=1690604 RepID=A0ABR0KI52_9EURO|nr:hypothetical protein LTR24_002429 [Lithohypha guttulata]KAK5326209.1 hypothetical protein LTR70_002209 [Exophiala xenobiotica]
MGTPANLYDQVNTVAHSLSPKQRYSDMAMTNDGRQVAFFGMEFHCDTQARSFCTADSDGSGNLVDYVLLTHNLRFIPSVSTTWRGFDQYRLSVRALDATASATLHQGNAISDSQLTDWIHNEFAAGTLQTATVESSSPPASQIGQSVSTSVGTSMGFDAGFFGPEPTATFSSGQDMSKTFSYSFDNVSVLDFGKDTIVDKMLVINHLTQDQTMQRDAAARNHTDFGFQTYEITMAELFKVPDDGNGDRSKTNPTTFRCFELSLTATRFLKNDTWTSSASEDEINLTTNKRQIIRVKAPPLPKPAAS